MILEKTLASKIQIVINSNHKQILLSEIFYKEPDLVIVNGLIRKDCKQYCNLEFDINSIILSFNDNINSCENMFLGLSNIIEIDLSNFDFSYVTTMKSMFKDCKHLKKIDFGNINTSKIVSMQSTFENCYNLISIDLSKFDTSLVTTFESMFYNCSSLKSIDTSNFNTTNAVNISNMFANCNQLISINLSNFDTSNIKNMKGIFYSCKNIKYIDLQNLVDNSLDIITELLDNNYNSLYINLKYFKIPNTHKINLNSVFGVDKSNIKICIENYNDKNIILKNKMNDCSNFCFQENVKFDVEKEICFCNEKYKYEYNNKCLQECPSNTYKIFKDKFICNGNNNNISAQEEHYHNYNYNDNKHLKNFLEFDRILGNNQIKIFRRNSFPTPNNGPGSNKCPGSGPGPNPGEDTTRVNNCPHAINSAQEDCEVEGYLPYGPINLNSGINPQEYKYEYNKCCYKQCPVNTKVYEKEQRCFDSCLTTQITDGNTCIDIKQSDTHKPETQHIIEEVETHVKCYYTCETCDSPGTEENHNCNTCKNDYIYKYNNKCLNQCQAPLKTSVNDKKCLDSCPSEQFEYDNSCYIDCPDGTNKIFIERNICIKTVPEGYYKDEHNIYQKCYDTCKICNKTGTAYSHNCEKCKDNYLFLKVFLANNNNCYARCDKNYYYFDVSSQYKCEDACPTGFKKIPAKKKCINDCVNDDDYKIEYNNECYMECPEKLKTDVKTNKCLQSCYDNQFEFENKCYYNLTGDIKNFFQSGNIYINNTDNFDNILYNIIFSAYPSEPGSEILVQSPDNKVFQITSSSNELEIIKDKSKNINGLSIVDLGECENVLKRENNINENDSLIFIKSEVKSNKASEKNVHIDVYNPYTKEKLNLSLCDQIPVGIYFPTELNTGTKSLYDKMKNYGYNMFDINDAFYQDICTPFDSSNGTDILLTDRIDYIYFNEDTQCQSNCEYNEYSMESQYLSCSCSITEEVDIENVKNEEFNTKKLYQSFYEVLKYSNYDILKCYKIILDINVIKTNLGSLIVIFFFVCYLTCLFIFIFRGIIPLKIKLRNELYKYPKGYNLFIRLKIDKLLYPPIKMKSNLRFLSINRRNKGNKKVYNNIIYMNINNNYDSIHSNKIIPNSSYKSCALDKYSKKNLYQEKNNQIKKDLSDFELNQLDYLKALKLDKRSFCQLYIALLNREHLIIFTFCNCNDYNLLAVKVSRFIFLLVGDMALNVFFFSDESMHKLFISYGKYDFIQQIPQITYSTIITQIIEIFLCYLSLTDVYIYRVKNNLIKGNIRNIKNIIKCLRIKLIIYFIFIFLFLCIYWYIISIFCGVYKNTQIPFIKDSLISFSIGLAYPFVFYFISACLRSCSLKSTKEKCKCLYDFSYIIPCF